MSTNVAIAEVNIHLRARTRDRSITDQAFQKVMDWLDSEPTAAEAAGMKRIRDASLPWQRG